MTRLEGFVGEAKRSKGIDAVIQMGDFCYSQPESEPCIKLFDSLAHPKFHVLGNHDMDKCDKQTAMRTWGMQNRYGAYDIGDYRLVILDLNHFKKGGKLFPYDSGNYYTDNATHNWADPEQLAWLSKELRSSTKPVLLISHQPLGFAEPGQAMPPEQVDVLKVVTDARKENKRGAVAICLFGHLHVDRLEYYEGIPCYCVNSASYFWGGEMYPYSKPLYAFAEITEGGQFVIPGMPGEFVKQPPSDTDNVIGRSASIQSRLIELPRGI